MNYELRIMETVIKLADAKLVCGIPFVSFAPLRNSICGFFGDYQLISVQ